VFASAAVHKSARCAHGNRGHPRHSAHLPPYSPDLNPIGQLFAKLKTLLRNAAARTVGALWAATGQLLQRFDPRECANYFAKAGYGLPNRNPL
jgi:transposase